MKRGREREERENKNKMSTLKDTCSRAFFQNSIISAFSLMMVVFITRNGLIGCRSKVSKVRLNKTEFATFVSLVCPLLPENLHSELI